MSHFCHWHKTSHHEVVLSDGISILEQQLDIHILLKIHMNSRYGLSDDKSHPITTLVSMDDP